MFSLFNDGLLAGIAESIFATTSRLPGDLPTIASRNPGLCGRSVHRSALLLGFRS
jgi:hypothetical protein